MRANSNYGIKRDLDRYERICRDLLAAGKIDQAAMDRQLDAIVEVEMAMPITPYDSWNWTEAAKTNLAKIRAYLGKHVA